MQKLYNRFRDAKLNYQNKTTSSRGSYYQNSLHQILYSTNLGIDFAQTLYCHASDIYLILLSISFPFSRRRKMRNFLIKSITLKSRQSHWFFFRFKKWITSYRQNFNHYFFKKLYYLLILSPSSIPIWVKLSVLWFLILSIEKVKQFQ